LGVGGDQGGRGENCRKAVKGKTVTTHRAYRAPESKKRKGRKKSLTLKGKREKGLCRQRGGPWGQEKKRSPSYSGQKKRALRICLGMRTKHKNEEKGRKWKFEREGEVNGKKRRRTAAGSG